MLDKIWNNLRVAEANQRLEKMSAEERVGWAVENLPAEFALASSFGVQAALSLHMVSQIKPDIQVILIDTGYLFKETYQFVDQLTERLNLNLRVFNAPISPAWQEARFGKLWEQGIDGLDKYNQINKVEPMERALDSLKVQTWFAGLMRTQSKSRSGLPVLQNIRGRLKVHPIIDWDNRKVYHYLKQNNLPYHPLWDKGYVSVGDNHSTVPLSEGMSEEDTRFGGLKRECGLHVDTLSGL